MFLQQVQGVFDVVVDKIGVDVLFFFNYDQNCVMSQFDGQVGLMCVVVVMLFILFGYLYVYYGEELGMCGVKLDFDLCELMCWECFICVSGEVSWKVFIVYDGVEVLVQVELVDLVLLFNCYCSLIDWCCEISVLCDGMLYVWLVGNCYVVVWCLDDVDSYVLVLYNLFVQL